MPLIRNAVRDAMRMQCEIGMRKGREGKERNGNACGRMPAHEGLAAACIGKKT